MNRLIPISRLMLKRVSDPVFFVALLFATLLWVITKLNHEYTDTIRIPATINSEEYDISCTVRGGGYYLLMDNLFPRTNTVELKREDLILGLSPDSSGHYHIPPTTLYNAISAKVKDVKVINVTAPITIAE